MNEFTQNHLTRWIASTHHATETAEHSRMFTLVASFADRHAQSLPYDFSWPDVLILAEREQAIMKEWRV